VQVTKSCTSKEGSQQTPLSQEQQQRVDRKLGSATGSRSLSGPKDLPVLQQIKQLSSSLTGRDNTGQGLGSPDAGTNIAHANDSKGLQAARLFSVHC